MQIINDCRSVEFLNNLFIKLFAQKQKQIFYIKGAGVYLLLTEGYCPTYRNSSIIIIILYLSTFLGGQLILIPVE